MKENGTLAATYTVRGDLSQSRSFLMGFAILGVVLFHVRARSVCPEGIVAEFLNEIVSLGHGGCDIFLFLSGFGLFFSLEKDANFPRYLGRRVRKLFPAYYPFILVYLCAVALIRGITGWEILGNLTFTGFWFHWENQFNWYVQAVMAFYLLAPGAYWCIRRWGTGRAAAVLLAFTAALQVIFWGSYPMIAITRLPVFFLGMLLGSWEKAETPWTKGWILGALAMLAAGIVFWRISKPYITWGNGLYWYPLLLMAPPTSLLLAAARPHWLKVKPLAAIDRVICRCGECSFEIYLVHLLFFETLLVDRKGNLFWLILGAVLTALGIGYHDLVAFVTKQRTRH